MHVLFVSANPESTMQLQLTDELRRFQQSMSGHAVKMTLLPAAQPDDLEIALKSKDFDVVHFCGHAEDEGILMRNRAGNEVLVDEEELGSLFANQSSLKLAILNACNTGKVAEHLKQHADTVIGTTRKLDDRAARTLTKVFYATLARKGSIAMAYTDAKKAVNRFDPDGKLYTGHGLENEEVLVRDEPSEENEFAYEGRDEFNAHFYVDHIDKQIKDLTDSTEKSKKWWRIFFGAGLVIGVILLWFMRDHIAWMMSMILFASGSAEERAANLATWQAFSGQPLMESIIIFGSTLPAFFATIKYRLLLNGKDELRTLEQMKRMVKSSTDLPPHLRKRLYSIMDQGLISAVAGDSPDKETNDDS